MGREPQVRGVNGSLQEESWVPQDFDRSIFRLLFLV